jgi:hypothetical protein
MNSLLCRHLRTKKMYIPAQAAEVRAENPERSSSSCHYWCNQTMTPVGRDDQPVHRDACQAGRPCFEA